MEGLRFLYGCLKNLSTSGVEGLLFSRSGKIEGHSLMSAGIGVDIQFWIPAFVAKAQSVVLKLSDRNFQCWIVELCVCRFPNAEMHGAAILAFGGLNSSGVEVAPLLCFLDSSSSSEK
ncbi:hypothetical protein V1477_008433 [Vespula maculifrons]|uniref:Uncharacterized protein n=1 Tax=Vespula maculifrons TaxID=7453 RepID=A0ABD2CD00_VESMC